METRTLKVQFLGQYTEATQPGEQTDVTLVLQNGETSAEHHLYMKGQQQEPCGQAQLIKTQESPPQEENHLVLQLCRKLFPRDPRSIWNGPHSLSHVLRKHLSTLHWKHS